MEKELMIILNNLIYEKLNLKEVEDRIYQYGIIGKEMVNDDRIKLKSKYLFLINRLYLNDLSESEKKELFDNVQKYDDSASEELVNYFAKIIDKVLFNPNDEPYVYYGPHILGNEVPSDSIVLSLHYLKYGQEEAQMDANEDFIIEIANEVQFVNGPASGYKVAVVIRDELQRDMIATL